MTVVQDAPETLGQGSRADGLRPLAASLAPAALIIAVQQIFFPAPSGIVVRGLIIGALTALVAVGMVLIYRANRIINFAQADLGFAPAVLAFLLMTESGVPWGIAAAAGLAAAVGLGAVTERLVIRRFFRAPRLLVTIATIGLSQVLAGAAILLPRFWGDAIVRGRIPAPFEFTWRVGGVNFGANDLLGLLVAVACIGLVMAFLRRSDVGVAVRASADSADRASLLGVPVYRLQSLVWMLASGLAFVTVFLRGGILGLPVLDSALAFPVLLRALVAFLLGRMTDLVGVTSAAFALGVLELGIVQNHDARTAQPVLALIVVIAILWRRREATRRDVTEETAWRGAEEVRPVPPALRSQRAVRVATAAFVAVTGTLAVVLPLLLDVAQLVRASAMLIFALLGLSLVLLSGWGGLISLGQVAYFAIGAALGGWVVLELGVDLYVAMLVAALAGAAAAVFVGLPTLRLPGLYLAVTTFAFALVTTQYLLNEDFFEWVPEQVRIERAPVLAGLEIASETQMYYFALVVLGLAVLALRNIRASRFGRALVALRDNDRAARAYGIDAAHIQLAAFALSGALAAIAGVLFMHHQRAFDSASYQPIENIAVLTMVVVGGMTSSAGAVLGAVFLLGSRWFLPSQWQVFVAGAGVIVVLLLAPGGLASVLFGVRDRLLRALARAQDLVVPGYTAMPREPDALAAPEPKPPGEGDAAVERTTAAAAVVPRHDRAAALLDAAEIEVSYGDVPVLFGVDLDVRRGEAVALLGTNGAGKSTMLRAISGLVPTTGGSITFDGTRIGGRPAHRIAELGLIQMPGGRGVFPTLTVGENLRVAGWLQRRDRAAVSAGIERVNALFPVLAEQAGERAANLSGGQQQMLALAMALLGDPKLLMIDELSLGLAPAVVAELLSFVGHLREQGTTLLVVEQSVNVALELADRAIFLERGEVRFDGPAAELLERPDLLRAVFLGSAASVDASRARGRQQPARLAASGNTSTMGASTAALESIDLSVSFGGVRAVNEVSFAVAPAEIVGVIGPNGAGKTTLFDLLSGFLRPELGHVRLDGVDVGGLRSSQRAQRGLGRSFQDARLFPSLTVDETIAAALERWVEVGGPVSAALGLPNAYDSERALQRRVDELVELLELGAYRWSFVGELSTGTRRVVDLGCLLAHAPSVVLLDEPAAGIAQREVEALAPLIRRIRDEMNASVVIVEHDIPLVEEVADRLVAMDQGRVLAVGTPTAVLSDAAVVASYLGGDVNSPSVSRSDRPMRAMQEGVRRATP